MVLIVSSPEAEKAEFYLPDDDYIREHGMQYSCSNEEWLFVCSEQTDYDEGNVTETLIYKHRATDRLIAISYTSNSWAEYDEDEFYSREVFLKEVTATAYVNSKGNILFLREKK